MENLENLTPHSRPMNRRSFLKLSGLLGLGVASSGIAPIHAEAIPFNKKTMKVSKTRLAMGTFVSMTLIHPSRDEAEQTMGLAFQEIDRLSTLLSRFQGGTAVFQLNQEGRLKGLPPEMKEVVARALYFHRVSGGTFDITVKPLVDLFKEAFGQKNGAAPSESEIERVLRLVGSDKIALRDGTLYFEKPGMGITLDGIDKGYIVDKASEILTRGHIQNHLINAGGDIRTRGTKADNKPWTVAVQDPLKRKNYPDIIHMRDGAIATSGNYEVFFDREKLFHHIVNPATGLSPEQSTSVSVLAKTTTEADALSTTVFVMGPAQGTAFIDGLPNCESLVIDKDGGLRKSRGWRGTTI